MGPELLGIKASAGSGKTYRLSLRYLGLLKRVGYPHPENLRRIVAITFTNKAAAEMKERILRFLKEISFGTPFGQKLSEETGLSAKEASAWLETIISHYSDFHVRTIDSLLFAILKGLSFELGIKPEAKVLFNEERILEEAFEALLARLNEDARFLWEEALSTYLVLDDKGGFYPEYGLKARLFDLYPKTRDGLKRVEVDPSAMEEAERELREAYAAFYELLEHLRPHLNGNKFRGLSENIDLQTLEGRVFLKEEVSELFKKSARVSEKEREAFEEALRQLKEKFEVWQSLQHLRAYTRVGGYVPILLSLRDLAEEICVREGIILGGDHWTRLILEEMRREATPPLIYAHFAARFSHFLFDEFQDTSRQQWEALYLLFEDALSENGSLFVVGDVKQAIFRWRGGDWNLFDEIFEAQKYFPSVSKPRKETLRNNFRSHPELVDFFNILFKPLTDKEVVKEKLAPLALGKGAFEEVKEEFAVSLAGAFSGHAQKARTRKGNPGQSVIKVYEVTGNKEENKALVKEKILEEIKAEWEKRKEISGQTPIAVLVKTHAEGEEVSSWLLHEGLPVVTENALRLKVSGVVKGILCFLFYLYEPRDLTALYGFLASGLLRDGPRNEEELAATWLKGDLGKWKNKVDELKARLRPLVNRRAPYELIWALMEELGLFERLESDLAPHQAFVERLLEVTHQFELEEGPSLAKYLAFWEEGGLEERVGLPENIRAVRVLTIHKAKGLEFPVVFIPFTDWRIRDLSPIEVHDGHLVHLKNPLPEDLERLRLKIRAEKAQELLNLFYVAVTRAEEALYLFITCPEGGGLRPVSFWIKTLLEESGLSCHVQPLTSG